MSEDQPPVKPPQELLQWISREYHDLNGTYFETLDEPPTALQFSRLVHVSRPVLIKGFQIPALQRWTDEYLLQKMGDQQISVAVTPNGRADSLSCGPDGQTYFVEPHTEQMTMGAFLPKLGASNQGDPTYYLQSQNGNLYSDRFFAQDEEDTSEFKSLRPDVPAEIPWCSKALEKTPDAVNIWIGDNKSVTSIHSDPYENIYTVVRGKKHLTLLPPTEGWCLKERIYPHATYTRSSPESPLRLEPSSKEVPPIRWSSITNPHMPGNLPDDAHPIHITLNAGETLYLPVGWWHYVRQSGRITIAINWWYDAEAQGINWVWLNFLRGVGNVLSEDTEKDEK